MENYYKCKALIAEIYKLKLPFDIIRKHIRPKLCTFIDMNGHTNEQLYIFIDIFIRCQQILKLLELNKKHKLLKYNNQYIYDVCHKYINNYSKEYKGHIIDIYNSLFELISYHNIKITKINEYCKKQFQRPYYKLKRTHMIKLINEFNIPFVYSRELITPYRREPIFIEKLKNMYKGYQIKNKEFCITLLDNTTINIKKGDKIKIYNMNYTFSSVNKLVIIYMYASRYYIRLPINEFISKFIIGK